MNSSVDPRLAEIKDCLYRVAVKAIVIKDKKILMVREAGDDWWGFPGGGIDHGESTIEALYRELTEEIGLEPNQVKISESPIMAEPGDNIDDVPRLNIYFKVEVLTDEIKVGTDIDEFGWYTSDELGKLYLSPSNAPQTPKIQILIEAS